MSDKKRQAIETIEKEITKEYGEGSIMRLGGETKLNIEQVLYH